MATLKERILQCIESGLHFSVSRVEVIKAFDGYGVDSETAKGISVVVDFVRSQSRIGLSLENIRKAIIDAGVDNDLVESILDKFHDEHSTKRSIEILKKYSASIRARGDEAMGSSVIVFGHGHSGVGYITTVVSTIFHFGCCHLLPEQKEIFGLRPNVNITAVRDGHVIVGSVNKIEIKVFMDIFPLVITHMNPDSFINSPPLREKFNSIYIHRDGRDAVAARLHFGWPQFNPCHVTDLRHSVLWFIYRAERWNRHVISFHRSRNSFLEIRFLDITLDELGTGRQKQVIEQIANYIGAFNTDVERIFHTISSSDDEIVWPSSNIKVRRKIGRYLDIFDQEMIVALHCLMGVGLVLTGYLSLNEYSPFIADNDRFTILFDRSEMAIVDQARMLLEENGKTIHDTIELSTLDNLNDLDQKQRYLIFTNTHFSIDNENFDLFPYYKMYRDCSLYLFEIRPKTRVVLNKTETKEIVIVVDTRNIYQVDPNDFGYPNGQEELTSHLVRFLRKYGVPFQIVNFTEMNTNGHEDILIAIEGVLGNFLLVKKLFPGYQGRLLSIYPFFDHVLLGEK